MENILQSHEAEPRKNLRAMAGKFPRGEGLGKNLRAMAGKFHEAEPRKNLRAMAGKFHEAEPRKNLRAMAGKFHEAEPRKNLRAVAGKPEAFRYVLRPSRKRLSSSAGTQHSSRMKNFTNVGQLRLINS
jgi:hypothetical protein